MPVRVSCSIFRLCTTLAAKSAKSSGSNCTTDGNGIVKRNVCGGDTASCGFGVSRLFAPPLLPPAPPPPPLLLLLLPLEAAVRLNVFTELLVTVATTRSYDTEHRPSVSTDTTTDRDTERGGVQRTCSSLTTCARYNT